MPAEVVCILGAVERELAPLRRRRLATARELTPRFHLTGVGKVAAAMTATSATMSERPALILQIGCAGAYPEHGLAIGDVVVATSEVLADEGVATPSGFLDLQALELPVLDGPLYNEIPTAFPPDALWDDVQSAAIGRFQCRAGRLATVSTGAGTDELAAEIGRRWRPLAESMEGAAVAVVARKFGCPFVEIRGISNHVGARDRRSWDLDVACEHAAEVAERLLRSPSVLESS